MRAPQYKSASKPTPPSVEPATARSAVTIAVTRSGRATKILSRFLSRVVCVLLLGILIAAAAFLIAAAAFESSVWRALCANFSSAAIQFLACSDL